MPVFQVMLVVKNPHANAEDTETQICSLGWEYALEESMAVHFSTIWRIPYLNLGATFHRTTKSWT